jgi:hypothetical protein
MVEYVFTAEACMTKLSWPLALAAALCVSMDVGVATAQTVIVRNAPPGSPVELVLNKATIASTSADLDGDATLPMNLPSGPGRNEIDASVYVDTCGALHRVLVVERDSAPPPEGPGCTRNAIGGVYLVRRITNLVVSLREPNPTVLLIQGSYSLRPAGPGKLWSRPPTGLVIFGGAGLAKSRDTVIVACGSVTPCSDNGWGGAYGVGAAYWILPFLAAEGAYLKPAQLKVNGSGENYRFSSFLDAELVTVAAKAGVPVRAARLYGQIGAGYHRATFGTTQTIDPVTVTVDGVTQTVAGGTQSFQRKTAGWGLMFGGGVEVWVVRSFAVYGEAGRAQLKGKTIEGAPGSFADVLPSLLFGARIHFGP